MNFAGKVCVVTGAGSGMGRQLSIQLARKSAIVIAIDYNPESLKETMSLLDDPANGHSHIVLDVTDNDKVVEAAESISEKYGGIDVLINNAGIAQPILPLSALELDQIRRVFEVNSFGVVYMTQAFLPYLKKSKEAHLANVSSMGAFAAVPGQVAYSGSKAAVHLYTEGLISELHDTSVGVTVIFPGAINTNITQNIPDMSEADKVQAIAAQKDYMEKNATSPEDAAGQILTAIEKKKQRLYIGKDSRMINIVSRLSPKLASGLIRWQIKKALPPGEDY